MQKVNLISKILLKFLQNLTLFIVAKSLQTILFPILLIWGCIEAFRRKELIEYFKDMAISLDATAGVIGQYALNKTLLRHEWIQTRFGDRRHTISYVMGLNKRNLNLSKFGLFIEKILNFIEPNHLEKAVKNEEQHERVRKRIC